MNYLGADDGFLSKLQQGLDVAKGPAQAGVDAAQQLKNPLGIPWWGWLFMYWAYKHRR
jgi:hypothetical protein